MKLWILKPIDDSVSPFDGWDVALGFVVRARGEKAARLWADGQAGDSKGAWINPSKTTCEELTSSGVAGIVIRDFKNG